MMRGLRRSTVLAFLIASTAAHGDGLLHSFDGDVLLGDPASGYDVFDPCEPDCTERFENGVYLLEWGPRGDFANFGRTVAGPGDPPPPPSLWVEWHFRSNQPKPPTSFSCDARMRVDFKDIAEITYMFQDWVVDFEGGDFVLDLEPEVFHTYRFESLDGVNFSVAVDGFIFNVDSGATGGQFAAVGPGGRADCVAGPDRPDPVRNEWDFIRYGTIGDGEQMVSVDPPVGDLAPEEGTQFASFVITFDQPAYLYIDDITVNVTGGVAPTIEATRRLDNGPPEVLEVLIDGPLPPGETTTFTFDTGTGPQSVSYYRIPPEVPAASAWGIAVMGIAALILGMFILRRRLAVA